MNPEIFSTIILLGSFLVMIFLRFPIAYAVGLSTVFCLLSQGQALVTLPQQMVKGVWSYSLMAVPFLPDSIMTRIMSLVSGFSNNGHIDTSAAHRLALWKGVSYMIRDYGVTGIGLGPASFNSLYPDYAQLGAVDGAYHTQTLYLELILEVGVLGLVSFIWMALRNIKNIVVARRGAGPVLKPVLIACAAALIGIAFSCCVEYIWFYPRNMFAYFILFGISIAAVNMANTKEIKDTL